MTQPPTGDEVKACCAAAYSSDIVALLLGGSYHPGGTALTRHLADGLTLTPGARVLDVASGRGTTALLIADLYGADVDGVDYAAGNTALARGAAQAAGLADRTRFTIGDAEQLPHPGGVFDAVVCECALCTFPDKARAADEFARVLKPGGRLGITDVTVDPGRLPLELTGLGARIACIADARPLDEYAEILAAAGLRTLAGSAGALANPPWGAAPPPWAPGRREEPHHMSHTGDDAEKTWCISEVDIFRDLSEAEMDAIAAAAPMKTYSAGELLYSPAQPSEVLFILKKAAFASSGCPPTVAP
ncbi:class I SAM-dependent methyltransferase [Streptomyces sp. NPDC018833]|uniref:class I SAM-dependent methyltransferase n=1 Tax=Streptomyces sp. NPDC018833 TaxID=3365053 RepID=UPI003796860C